MIDIVNEEGLKFLAKLPDDSVDLVLTDPPYLTSKDTGMDRWVAHVAKQNKLGATNAKSEQDWLNYKTEKQWKAWMDKGEIPEDRREKKLVSLKKSYIKYGSIYGEKYAVVTDYSTADGTWDSEFTMPKLELFVKEFYRVLKPGGTCIVFFDVWKLSCIKKYMEDEKFKQLRLVEWVKTNPPPINSNVNYLNNCREIAVLGVKKGKPTFNSSYDKGIYKYPVYGGKDRFHPTQKSLPLFEELIKKHCNEGDLVLDCFLGSGTTAIAALNTGRSFVGCELGKEYCDKAKERLEHYSNKKE